MGDDKKRFVSPPADQFPQLRRPPTPGQLEVFRIFDEFLPAEWEIYFRPHLNGMRPDFILLHPEIGIAVFEVKDWDASAIKNGLPDRDPVRRIDRIKQKIFDLYCPRLGAQSGLQAITGGLVFPYLDRGDVMRLLGPSYQGKHLHTQAYFYPISGAEEVRARALTDIFPASQQYDSKGMNPMLARDLRRWLIEPDFSAAQRTGLDLDDDQKRYVRTRAEKTGYRRLRGPAGSGKSLVLAARATELMSEGKDVLVVSYNITLWHYLRDLANRWRPSGTSSEGSISYTHFHLWCKDVCEEAERDEEYHELWAGQGGNGRDNESITRFSHDSILSEDLPELVMRVVREDKAGLVPHYDAVLVDEGQDFEPTWWQALRGVLRPNGEMLLAADATQDVYQTARAWTDDVMRGAGFSGPWAELRYSYRLPPAMVDAAILFAQQHLPRDLADPPVVRPEQQIRPCDMRWIQTDKDQAAKVCTQAILDLSPLADPKLLAIPDITFLAPSQELGLAVVHELRERGIEVLHTFSKDARESRRLKVAFFLNEEGEETTLEGSEARIKATTLHSFKGWETRALVLYTGHNLSRRSLALTYAGLTRVKADVERSYVTVVSAMPELEQYGRRFNQLSDPPAG